ncbi:MAG: DUF3987 domain-containing protein [Phaeodactylibacter sp.]|nr:DUF3987 domain-containing protein [Phaeodactylibacter sp.]
MVEINNGHAGSMANLNGKGMHHEDKAFNFTIPEGTSLNDTEEAPGFPQEVYNSLPKLLRQACLEVLKEEAEREAFLVGALGVVSGILPNIQGFYDQDFTGPNLYVYILATYGTGKGFLKFAKELAKPIHQQKRERAAQALEEYQIELEESKNGKGQAPPPRPGNFMLFLPANNSKTGLLQLLHENLGKGILFETETDTLADALATDYGNFSDLLRKAFHGETTTFYRRTEQEYREIEKPAFSVVLSSTFDQLIKLIPTIQNGLYSRFLFYQLQGSREFRNVFNREKEVYPEYFAKLGQEFLKIHDELEALPEPLQFRLQPHQEAQFVTLFDEWKHELGEITGADLDGMVNRLGLITFRIAMQFTALRAFENGSLEDTLVCDEIDFQNALRIVATLRKNAIDIYYKLPRPKANKEASELEKEFMGKAEQVALCRQMKTQGLTYAEIAEAVLNDPKKKSKVFYWLNKQ